MNTPQLSFQPSLVLIAFASLLAALVSSVSWPGFMSYDSVLALQQARDGITESGYPPMVSYVWILADAVLPGQGGMFLLQNLLVFLGVAGFGLAVRAPHWLLASVLALIALAPATLGPMLVVWKDIAFGGWLALAATCAAVHWRVGRGPWLWLSLLFLAIGAAYRLNSLPALVPLLILLTWRTFSTRFTAPVLVGSATVLTTALLSVLLLAWVMALSTWRLPDLRRLHPPSGHHGWVVAADLIGIEVCSGKRWLPEPFFPEGVEPETLPDLYHPEHVHRSFYRSGDRPRLRDAGFDEVGPGLQRIWRDAVFTHPLCYLRHRALVGMHMLGLNAGRVFYVTDPGVFPNEMVPDLRQTRWTRWGVDWVRERSDSPLARTWVFMLTALAVLAWGGWRRGWNPLAAAIFASGVAYLAVGVLLLPAADLRYQFWTILTMLMTVLAVAGRSHRQARSEP